MKKSLLKKYAELIVRSGIALKKGQTVVIRANVGIEPFTAMVVEECYRNGAKRVIVEWGSEECARAAYKKGKKENLAEVLPYEVEKEKWFNEELPCFLWLDSDDPDAMAGLNQDKMAFIRRKRMAALYPLKIQRENHYQWCIAGVPSPAWAKKVFPELGEEEAKARLWQEIFRTVRIEPETDPAAAWTEHIATLQKAAEFLNKQNFKTLHYKNSLGTDLTVELPEGHIWAGGAEKSATGVTFAANMPTEEVYSLPLREGVNGTVYASKPLIYNGNRIENFHLTFKEGRVVDFGAEVGEETLKELINMDEGSHYLGEVALVPYDSPISNSGILFYNTLFDENAACHLALGKAYPTCLEGGEKMDSVTLLQHGVNDSLVHEDFMIGTADLSIVGITREGEKVEIFRNGNFAPGVLD